MPENLDTAAGSLSDYTRKLEIATFYANGDEERAKQIVAGALKDFYAIKGRFASTTSYGAFIAFANISYLSLNSLFVVISNSFELKDIKTFDEWMTYERDITEFMKNNEHDDVLARQFKNTFSGSFTYQFASELRKLVSEKKDMDINRLFQQVVQSRMGLQNVNMVVDVEEISSVEMELNSITCSKMAEQPRGKDKGGGEPDIQVDTDEDEKEVLKGKDVRMLLRGSLILSPLGGREIGLLVVGDRLKINITDRHEKAIHVLKAFDAIDEDGVRPIMGRIVHVKHRVDGGYTIYTVVAKGIYVKIEEMEEGIKVAIDNASQNAKAEPQGMSRATIGILAGLAVVLVVLVALIIYVFTR
ncbi:MAG: hypothetical protein KA369_15170 [Spirochaetes bacterium]|nr:hypothetical protein [Spirochaetota bacterium]